MERNSLFVWLEKEGKQDSEENWGSLLIVCFPGSEEGGNSSDVYESCVSVAKVFWNSFPFLYFLILDQVFPIWNIHFWNWVLLRNGKSMIKKKISKNQNYGVIFLRRFVKVFEAGVGIFVPKISKIRYRNDSSSWK
jgi:hypothetical protein